MTVGPLDSGDARCLGQATELLASSLPAQCRGMAAYDADRYDVYLAAALVPEPDARTLHLRGVRARGAIRAIADWRVGSDSLFLNGLAVREEDRGKGLASQLLKDGIEMSTRLGLTTIAMDVCVENAPAQALYRKWRFQPSGHQSWIDVTDRADTRSRVAVLDWPTYAAQMAAYGFGDLTVRDEQGAAWVVRTVGDVLRIPFGLRTRNIVGALPITAKRAYAVTPGTPGPDVVIASFERLQRDRRLPDR
jgi:ribosomal protein S18 acetylase RimI-like enzyme